MPCNYEVEIDEKNGDKSIFKGPLKFIVKPKDVLNYELSFLPNSEDKFEVINFSSAFHSKKNLS